MFDKLRTTERSARDTSRGVWPNLPVLERGEDDYRVPDTYVLFTSRAATLAALQAASRLVCGIGSRPTLLLFYAVPLSLPMEMRFVPRDILNGRILSLISASKVEFTAQVFICRHPERCLRQLLPPQSLVVIGGKKRWWLNRESRLAGRLMRDGHLVTFVEAGKHRRHVTERVVEEFVGLL